MILGLSGVLVGGVAAWIFYLDYVGPVFVGPKRDVERQCQQVLPDMSEQEIYDLYMKNDPSETIVDPVYVAPDRLQVFMASKNGFSCICQVDMSEGQSVAPGETFCVD